MDDRLFNARGKIRGANWMDWSEVSSGNRKIGMYAFLFLVECNTLKPEFRILLFYV